MTTVRAWGARAAGAPLEPLSIERREPGPHDIELDVLFCGVCHSDVHQARDEWSGATFPMVPGHEIVGRVVRVGSAVTRFKPGDHAGVGCMVDACLACDPCHDHHEQCCERGPAFTYNSTEMDRVTPTHGGYSTRVVVRDHFALRIPDGLDLAAAAPLLCAGITTYSPLRQWNLRAGQRVGVVGLGGLGHMAVKFAASMGARVTVFSSSKGKEDDARRLGADDFVCTASPSAFGPLASKFDLLVDTVSAAHDYNAYLSTLRPFGTMVLVGAPAEPTGLHAFSLIPANRRLAGSMIGGIAETQEMLDYCGAHGIVADVERIAIQQINEAYARMLKSDVRYRFVIDTTSLTA